MADNANVSKLTAFRRNFVRFFKDIRAELKKVIWPTKEQLVNYTLTVLGACLVIGAIIWIADFGMVKIAGLVFK